MADRGAWPKKILNADWLEEMAGGLNGPIREFRAKIFEKCSPLIGLYVGTVGVSPCENNLLKNVRLVEANISGLYTFSHPELIYRDKGH